MRWGIVAAAIGVALQSGQALAGGTSVALFASGKLFRQGMPSFFSTASAAGTAPYNACEEGVAATLLQRGFALPAGNLSEEQRMGARRMRAVFARYSLASTLPNDLAIQAGRILQPELRSVVACGITVKARRPRGGGEAESCAVAECKAIDAARRRRLAVANGERCEPGSEPISTGRAAARALCRDVSRILVERMGASGPEANLVSVAGQQ